MHPTERFEPDNGNVRAARRLVVRALSPTDDAQAAALLTSELSQNAVDHAQTPFTVAVGHDSDGALIVEVHDHSPEPPQLAPRDPGAARGRGLQLVEALSDAWGFTSFPDDGKTVWFRLTPAAG